MSLRLAAISLLVLQREEDAFWCLVAVVEAIMPQDYYTKSLVASQVRRHSPVHLYSDQLISVQNKLLVTFSCSQISIKLFMETSCFIILVPGDSCAADLLCSDSEKCSPGSFI